MLHFKNGSDSNLTLEIAKETRGLLSFIDRGDRSLRPESVNIKAYDSWEGGCAFLTHND